MRSDNKEVIIVRSDNQELLIVRFDNQEFLIVRSDNKEILIVRSDCIELLAGMLAVTFPSLSLLFCCLLTRLKLASCYK